MESIKEIQSINKIEIIKPTPATAENENGNNWNIKEAEILNPNKTDKILLTIEDALQHMEGEIYIEKVQELIDTSTEYYIQEFFYYNNLELINNDLKVYLTNNWRHEEFIQNLKIECLPEYNPLLERMQLDPEDYYQIEKYYRPTPESESIDFLTYYIMEEYLEQQDTIKTEITDIDILKIIRTLDQDQQELLRQVNYKELFQDIQEAYKKLITDILEESQEALQDKYYEEIYYPALEYAERDLLNQLPEYIHNL